MGRPADQFCWDNVDKLPEGQWRCKHCKGEFSGAASRIRNHLSGEGTDIGSCEKVPSHIREEALNRASKKRRRKSSLREGDGISDANRLEVDTAFANDGLEMTTALQVSSFNGDLSTHNNKGSEEEYTTDVLVKFLMSQNLPVNVFKNPHFRNLLMRVAQHGMPSCLDRDDSIGIQKSIWNLEHEVNEYMSMVKGSWKTIGCTLIPYNLHKGRGSPSDVGTDNIVYGFYCPKGFIFFEGRHLDFSQGLEHAFKSHVLNISITDVTHEIEHSGSGCEFSQQATTSYGLKRISCIRQKVEEVWMRICRETGWVHNLIQKSENLYHYMLQSPWLNQCKGWRKLMVEKDADATPMSSFTRLRSIMHLEDGIKAWPSNVLKNRISCLKLGVEEIINNNEFWCDGKELLKALTPLLNIIDVVDSLVPNISYLQVAIDNAKRRLKPYYEQEASRYQLIWQSLSLLAELDKTVQVAMCNYLSPVYDWRAKEDEKVELDSQIGSFVRISYYYKDFEDEKDKFDAERKGYRDNNPFANVTRLEQHTTHAVKLWNKYGGEFPLLRKLAIKVLSQPGSCMCSQVKKHIKQFQGEDNFILRLNYHMMQQFSTLGDAIYKPLELPFKVRDLILLKDDVPASIPNQISIKKLVDGPQIGHIPVWMNEFISKSIDVIADGNCGYRAIAESLGLGQDKWREVRQKLHNVLNLRPWWYEDTFVLDETVDSISKALNYNGSGNAPPENRFNITNMGLLVATTFQAIFVVLGPAISHTYLPLDLEPEEYSFLYVPEIVICHIPECSHFTSLSLMKNAPLPPVYHMWDSNCNESTEDFADFIKGRLNSYCTLEGAEDPHDEDEVPSSIPNPISAKKMVNDPHIGQIPVWMYQFISKSTNVMADGNCGYRAIY